MSDSGSDRLVREGRNEVRGRLLGVVSGVDGRRVLFDGPTAHVSLEDDFLRGSGGVVHGLLFIALQRV
jgi:hypothetical protein